MNIQQAEDICMAHKVGLFRGKRSELALAVLTLAQHECESAEEGRDLSEEIVDMDEESLPF